MDWQLHNIGKTITNNILPSSLTGVTVILSIGGSRLFPCISVSCHVIPMDTHWLYIVGQIKFNSMNHAGHVYTIISTEPALNENDDAKL